jgi:hypothetical protein
LGLKQLDALMRAHRRATRDREYLFGQLTATVVNFSLCHPEDKLVTPEEYMPSERRKRYQEELAADAEMSDEEHQQRTADYFRQMLAPYIDK